MCGITGGLGSNALSPERLVAMAETLSHRGPNDKGFLIEGPAFLAMTRLSIIDIEGGHQPMRSRDGDVSIVFNGEIYNFYELRSELSGSFEFLTNSDTEVILNGYLAWGLGVFRRLNGIFAVAVWDRRQRRLFLARDPVGVKPLYTLDTADAFYFSSELKTFTQLRLANDINMYGITQFLSAGYVFNPTTAVAGVVQLKPGQVLSVGVDGERVASQFRLPADLRVPNEAIRGDDIGSALSRTVISQTIADVPFGVLLSSGLDSMALIGALRQAKMLDNVKTYTVAFNNSSFGEQEHVRKLSSRLGFKNTEVLLTPARVRELWDSACITFDNLEFLPTALAIQLASRAAAADVRVLLAGNGGDEIFFGYPTYQATDFVRRYGRLIGPVVPIARRIAQLFPSKHAYLSYSERMRRFFEAFDPDPIRAHGQWRYIFLNREVRELIGCSQSAEEIYGPQAAYYRDAKAMGYSAIDVFSWGDLRTWLVDCGLMMWDKAGMSAGVEIRVPLVDPHLLDVVYSAPTVIRAGKHLGKKQAMRELLSHMVPSEFLTLPKRGFQIPVVEWISGPLKPMFQELISDLPSHVFDVKAIRLLWKQLEENRGDRALQLWCLGALSGWARAHHIRWG
jgi:asparagine synthase (glutamine-hydrolysing)